jgi:hypothetical protein
MSLEREFSQHGLVAASMASGVRGGLSYRHTGSLRRGAIVFRHRSAEMNRLPCIALDGNGRRDGVFN